MAIFHFQHEQEIFWRYLSRLNDFSCSMCWYFENWEIRQVIFEGVNSKYRGHIETMCLGFWWVCFLNIMVKSGTSLNIRLMTTGSIKMLERIWIIRFQLYVLIFCVIIVNIQVIVLMLVHFSLCFLILLCSHYLWLIVLL